MSIEPQVRPWGLPSCLSIEESVQFFAESAENTALGDVHGVDRDAQIARDLVRRPFTGDEFPACLPRIRFEFSLH